MNMKKTTFCGMQRGFFPSFDEVFVLTEGGELFLTGHHNFLILRDAWSKIMSLDTKKKKYNEKNRVLAK